MNDSTDELEGLNLKLRKEPEWSGQGAFAESLLSRNYQFVPI
jgi:hypothetical protein